MAGWEQLGGRGRRFRKRPQLPSLLFLLLVLLLLLLLLLWLPLGCLYPYWGRGGGDEPRCPAAAAAASVVSSATTAAMKRKTSGVGSRRHSAPATLPATAPPASKKTRSSATLQVLGEAEEQTLQTPKREICLQISGEEQQKKGALRGIGATENPPPPK